jgi:divalent metal cation (Fe/Co/Zn/Cd) transporter
LPALEKATLLVRAIRLEWLTIGWTAIAGAAAFVAGVWAHSVSLHAFALDSAVESVCAGVLIVRLRSELERRPDAGVWERIAARIVGVLLLAAAAYITVNALWHLLAHRGQDVSLPGIALTIATIPIMAPLAHHKLAIARLLPSRALRADAVGNAVCWYLAALVLAGLAAQGIFRAWWLDSAASLAVVALLVAEGWQALGVPADQHV